MKNQNNDPIFYIYYQKYRTLSINVEQNALCINKKLKKYDIMKKIQKRQRRYRLKY